ncbi:hypothetical protein Ae150APs1_4835c [Pseudonocardia sp. Ae150A_Ps1]|nr:hypothetical protein Ae150APs1_4835c [Pseudonocardia sp. Ae150A_Ps1]
MWTRPARARPGTTGTSAAQFVDRSVDRARRPAAPTTAVPLTAWRLAAPLAVRSAAM